MISTLKTLAKAVFVSAFLTAPFAHARDLNMSDMTESEFGDLVRGAERSGETIFIPPSPMEDLVSRASLQGSGIGDFIYISAMDPTAQTDDSITSDSITELYQTFKRVSRLGFRISMKLTGRLNDIRDALQTTTPTILVLTAHGNEQGVYDSDRRLPSDLYKNASPNVYQVILLSCHGANSLKAVYNNERPKTMKVWGWSRLVYAADLGKFVNDPAQWNPFENYPGEPTVKGLICKKDAGNKFALFKGETRIGLPIWATKEQCLQRAQQSNQSFVCAPTDDKGGLGLYSVVTGQPIEGLRYDNATKGTCFLLPTRAFGEKICRSAPKVPGSKEEVHRIIPAATGTFDMSREFKDYESCVNSIMNSQEI